MSGTYRSGTAILAVDSTGKGVLMSLVAVLTLLAAEPGSPATETPFQKATIEYRLCLIKQALHFAKASTESATVVAEAAIGRCSDLQFNLGPAFRVTAKAVPNDMAEQFIRDFVETERRHLLGDIMDARAPGHRP